MKWYQVSVCFRNITIRSLNIFFVSVVQIHNYARLMSLLKLQQHVAKKEMQMPQFWNLRLENLLPFAAAAIVT